MSKKSGLTMIMMIMFIVVAVTIMGAVISTYLNNDSIKETTGNVFKAQIQDYIDEFNNSKQYFIMNGEFDSSTSIKDLERDSYGRSIIEYIPSITYSDKKFICIFEGQLAFYDVSPTDIRYQYLTQLGLVDEEQ